MAKVAITEQYLEDIADAIRGKTGVNVTYYPAEMADAISTIASSGGITPSGTLSISENGTYNVTSYVSAEVEVASGGGGYVTQAADGSVTFSATSGPPTLISKSITQNGTYDPASDNADGYSSVTVDVSGGGGGSGLVYESGTWTPSADTADYTISFTGTHTTAPFFYVINDSEGDYYTEANSNIQVRFVCPSLLGVDLYITGTNVQYATIVSQYRGTSTTTFSGNTTSVTTNGSAVLSDYATSTGIRAYTNSTSRYWRAGRAYKWIAVWAPTI